MHRRCSVRLLSLFVRVHETFRLSRPIAHTLPFLYFSGNMRWTLGMAGGGCNVAPDQSKPTAGLVHTETQTVPLFLHTPGKFLECLDHLADTLEITHLLSDSTQSQRLLRGAPARRVQSNYGSESPTASPTVSNFPSESPISSDSPTGASSPTSVPTSSPTGQTASPTAAASAAPTPGLQVAERNEFDVTSAFFGPVLPFHVKITDIMSPGGVAGITINVREISIGNMTGDIRGVFFHVDGDTSSITGSDFISATGPNAGQNYLGLHQSKKNQVMRIGRTDVSIKERKKPGRTYDVGMEIGTKGIDIDDIKETTITIMGLSTRRITGEFAVLSRRIGDKNKKRRKRGYRKFNSAMITMVPAMP
jgi:hypothetical protein